MIVQKAVHAYGKEVPLAYISEKAPKILQDDAKRQKSSVCSQGLGYMEFPETALERCGHQLRLGAMGEGRNREGESK